MYLSTYVCLYVCMSVCLYVCTPVCLSVCKILYDGSVHRGESSKNNDQKQSTNDKKLEI